MKSKNNEHGYALLTVIMLVLLFTVLGMGLLAMNMNASNQFNVKEKQVQARHYAEMGLLHYKARIENDIKDYKFTATKEEEERAITNSRSDLCGIIEGIGLLEKKLSVGSYEVPPADLNCGPGDAGNITITMYSTGYASNGTDKLVEGKMEITPPEIIAVSPNPGAGTSDPTKPPKNNTGSEPITVYPYDPKVYPPNPKTGELEVKGFVKLTEKFTISRTAYHFESLVVELPSPSSTALEISPGKGGEVLRVEKDLYIGGGIASNNHGCIYVKGNLTVLGNIDLGPHFLIKVYGDAYFQEEISKDKKAINNNSNIQVMGTTYEGPTKKIVGSYKDFKSVKFCENDVAWPEPEVGVQPGLEYKWELDEDLNAIYH